MSSIDARRQVRLFIPVALFAVGCGARGSTPTDGSRDGQTPIRDASIDLPARATRGKGVDIVAVLSNTGGGPDAVAVPGATIYALLDEFKRRGMDYRLGVTSSTMDWEGPGSCPVASVLRRAAFVRPEAERPERWSGPWPPPPLVSPSLNPGGDVAVAAHSYANPAVAPPSCEITQYLEAAFSATDGRNASFPRKEALLVLLILSTREDCSTADHTLWNQSTGWLQDIQANARCSQPPSGLLQPLDGMVTRLLKTHPSGPILTYVVGSNADAVFEAYPDPKNTTGALWVKPDCASSNVSVMPATRLAGFVSRVRSQAVRGVSAIFDDAMCEALISRTDAGIAARLAKAISERIH